MARLIWPLSASRPEKAMMAPPPTLRMRPRTLAGWALAKALISHQPPTTTTRPMMKLVMPPPFTSSA